MMVIDTGTVTFTPFMSTTIRAGVEVVGIMATILVAWVGGGWLGTCGTTTRLPYIPIPMRTHRLL